MNIGSRSKHNQISDLPNWYICKFDKNLVQASAGKLILAKMQHSNSHPDCENEIKVTKI